MSLTSRCSSALAVGAVLLMAACSGEVQPRKGQLMVVLQTDMSVPRDFNRIKVMIRVAGKTEHDATYAVAPDGSTKLPGTIAVVAGSEVAPTVEVRVIGIAESGDAQTFSKVVTTVPRERVATLRVPLQWLCVGSVVQTGEGEGAEYESGCEMEDGEEGACVAGRCKKVAVAEESLAEFQAVEVFGGGVEPGDPSATCFDTQACFSLGFPVEPVLEESGDYCRVRVTAPLGREPNFAIRTAPNGPGICDPKDPSAPCFVPLDQNDDFGFRVLGAPRPDSQNEAQVTHEVALPEGVCDRLVEDPTLALVATTACPAKTAAIPTCGPWSATEEKVDEGVPFDELWEAVADAYCTGISGCCAAASLPFDLETCKEERASLFEALTAGWEDLSFTYDPIAAASCLRVYQRTTAACSEDSEAVDAACDPVFQGELPDGASCEQSSECREPGSICQGQVYAEGGLTPIAPGTCAPDPLAAHGKPGDACRGTCRTSAEGCYESVSSDVVGGVACHSTDGLYCDGVTFDALGTCREILPEGAPCVAGDSCGPGAHCSPKSDTDFSYVCQPKVESGPCTSYGACVDTSFCASDGMCQPKRAAGEPCSLFEECQSNDCTEEGLCAGPITATDCSGGIF